MQLAPGEIHCWSISLDVTHSTCVALSALLSPGERSRSARMRYRTPRRRFIAAHGALRKLLGAYLGLHPSELGFVHNEFGKPALDGAGQGQFGGRLSFNLSHSGDLALIGVAVDAEIGVDVEYIRQEPD